MPFEKPALAVIWHVSFSDPLINRMLEWPPNSIGAIYTQSTWNFYTTLQMLLCSVNCIELYAYLTYEQTSYLTLWDHFSAPETSLFWTLSPSIPIFCPIDSKKIQKRFALICLSKFNLVQCVPSRYLSDPRSSGTLTAVTAEKSFNRRFFIFKSDLRSSQSTLIND